MCVWMAWYMYKGLQPHKCQQWHASTDLNLKYIIIHIICYSSTSINTNESRNDWGKKEVIQCPQHLTDCINISHHAWIHFCETLNLTKCTLTHLYVFLSNLFASIEEPLSLRLNIEKLHDSQPQLVHLREFGQGVDPVGLLTVHSAHLDPHCSSPTPTWVRDKDVNPLHFTLEEE